MKKDVLKSIYLIYEAIDKTEEIFTKSDIVHTNFFSLSAIRDEVGVLYKIFDCEEEYPIIDTFYSIMNNKGMFDYDKIPEEHLSKYRTNNFIKLSQEFKKEFSYAFIHLNTLDEVLDYMVEKEYIEK